MIAIGDRFRFGDCLLEVSEPRAPCYKFAIHTGRPEAPFHMTRSGRTGWYLRVVDAGRPALRPAALRLDRRSGGPSVRETFFATKDPKAGSDLRARVVAEPALGTDWRTAVLARENG
jgi:MOSC domain-containing protein YiiM